jgi:hypothetical protein
MSIPNDSILPDGEESIARILHRAVELQERDRKQGMLPANGPRGVSLAELKQMAEEVGINPRYVEAAAAELQQRNTAEGGFHLWGAPSRTELSQVAAGELSQEEWDTLVDLIRRGTGKVGKVTTLGRALEWSSDTTHISLSPKGGQTRIQILSRYTDWAVAAYLSAASSGMLLIAILGGAMHQPPLEAVGLSILGVGAAFGVVRGRIQALYRSHHRKMKSLLQHLVEHVTETTLAASGEEQPPG